MELKKLLQKQCKEVISIGFSEQGIKAAVVVRDDELYAVKVMRREWPQALQENRYLENAAAAAAVISELLDEQKLTALHKAAFVIAGTDVIIRQISFPKMAEKELLEAFRWEREQYIPYEEDACCQRLQIVQHEEESCLLIKALPKAEADYFTAVSEAAGLELLMLTTEELAAASFMPEQSEQLQPAFGRVKWDGSFLSEAEQQEVAAAYYCELGTGAAVLSGDDIGLLPEKETFTSKAMFFKVAAVIYTAAIIFLWSGAYIFSCWQDFKLERGEYKLNTLATWQQRYEQYTQLQNKIDELQQLADKLGRDRQQWSLLLEFFGREIPKGCWINKVSETDGEKNSIEVEGKAVDIKSIDTFIDRLQQHQELTGVELKSTRSSADGNREDHVVYSIVLQFKGEKYE